MTLEERFWEKVDVRAPEECWEWRAGKRGSLGYGGFRDAAQRWVSAHRWAYESFVAPIPEGVEITHLCENPSCVNPSHLAPRMNPMADLTTEERFWSNVALAGPSECWIWQQELTKGYGLFWDGPRTSKQHRAHQAHRWAYESLVGPIPGGLVIDHLCRQPACVNPAHLEPVTQRENMLRGESPSAKAFRRRREQEGCSCDPRGDGHSGWTDPNCPVHGEQEGEARSMISGEDGQDHAPPEPGDSIQPKRCPRETDG